MQQQNGELLGAMNEALSREISTMVRYLVQGSSIHGLRNEPLRNMYRKEVSDELGHAQYLADKIVAMGGTPKVKPDLSAPPADVSKMIKNDLAAEEKDVEHYRRLAEMAEQSGDVELKVKMEELAADEARHADELRRLQG
jgi:bacterioferritin